MTQLITAAEIPRYTGSLEHLEQAIASIDRDGRAIADDSTQLHATFQGLGAHYQAAEAEDLLASTAPVRDLGDEIGRATTDLVSTLRVYAAEVRAIDHTLRTLQDRATALPAATPADELEPHVIAASQQIRYELGRAIAQFSDIEHAAAQRINALLPVGAGRPGWDRSSSSAAVDQFLALAGQPFLSRTDLAQLNALLEVHSDNPLFAQQVLEELGVEGLLALSERLGYSFNPALGVSSGDIETARQGLANTLATASAIPSHLSHLPPEDPAFQAWLGTKAGQRWNALMEQTKQYGMQPRTKEYGLGHEVRTGEYGYHDLLTFMERADRPFGGQYLDGIVGDIIAGQEHAPGFDISRDGFRQGGSLLDRTLDLSSRDPAAAALILDPDRSTGHLDFALQRAAMADNFVGPFGITGLPGHSQGLANALQAAATGLPVGTPIPPDAPPPNEINARIAQNLMDRVAAGETGSSLNPALGNVAALYIGDFNHAMYEAPLPQHEHHLTMNQDQAEAILRNLGSDPHAYMALMEAQQAYALVTVDYAFNPDTTISDHLRPQILDRGATAGGHVMGVLTEARAQAAYESELDPNLHKDKRLTQHLLTSVSDTLTLNAPVISTAMANEMVAVNDALYASREREQLENAQAAADEISRSGRHAAKETYASAVDVIAEHMDYGAELDANMNKSHLRELVEGGYGNGSNRDG
jgi:hypothetical protein